MMPPSDNMDNSYILKTNNTIVYVPNFYTMCLIYTTQAPRFFGIDLFSSKLYLHS